MDNKSVFLTGASGLLGSTILAELRKSNFQIKQLIRSKITNEVRDYYVTGDLLNPVSFEGELAGLETVIHCAAVISYDSKDRKQLYQVNVEGTRSLINTALFYGVKNFIFISSASTMIRSSDELLVSDQAIGQPIFNSYYAETKYLAELEVWRGAAEGLNVCILNPSLILGQGTWDRSSMQIFQKVKNGLSFYPPGNLGLISSQDIAKIVLKVIEENLWSKQLLLNAETWSYKEFLNTIAKSLQLKPINLEANQLTANILAIWEGIAASFFNKKALISKESIQTSFCKFRYEDNQSRKTLDFEYISIEALIHELCQ